MKVFIFGASAAGKSCYHKIKDYCDILGFIDNDPNKWGKIKKDGIIIYSPRELEDKSKYDVIIIASIYYQEIISQLEKKDIKNFIFSPISPDDFKHPKFDTYLEYCRQANEFYKKVSLLQNRIDTLAISEYNKAYFMKKTIREIYLYAEFLWTVFKFHGLTHTLLDYGGGSGLLGMFASYLGIENVYYNDIYDISCQDAKVVAKEMSIEIKDYICGDIKEVFEYARMKDLHFDAVISYDVIEHIYDLESFFQELVQVCHRDCFISMWTTANSYNPDIVKHLENRHYRSEYLGSQKVKGWKERDSLLAYVKIRERIIKDYFINQGVTIDERDIADLVKNTRGKNKEDIHRYLAQYSLAERNSTTQNVKFPSNTCDPLTGNWAEHLIDFDELAKNVRSFENVFILPASNKNTADLLGFCLQDKAYTYVLEERIDEQEQYLYRYEMYYKTIIKWLSKMTSGCKVTDWFLKRGINAIIIYGGGELGRILYEQLKMDSKVNVKAVCDQNTKDLAMTFYGAKIIGTDKLVEEYNQGEIIVVTPIYAFDSISKFLSDRINGEIINLNTIIEEM